MTAFIVTISATRRIGHIVGKERIAQELGHELYWVAIPHLQPLDLSVACGPLNAVLLPVPGRAGPHVINQLAQRTRVMEGGVVSILHLKKNVTGRFSLLLG
jgi:hypothetical protein